MSPESRSRALLAWAHFYFLLSFRWWYATPHSFSAEGLEELNSLPVWGLTWLPRLPGPVVQLVLQALAFTALAGLFFSCSESSKERARLLLWPVIGGKLYLYVLDLRLFSTYHHMHFLMAILLALGASRFWLQLAMAQIYFFSGLGKLNESWLHGEYFQSVPDGLPLLGSSPGVLLVASCWVVVLEFLGPVCWFAPWKGVRRFSVLAFFAFHFYSGFIVGFRYPLLMLPLCYLVLWPLDRPVQANFQRRRRDIPGAFLLGFTFLIGWTPYLVSGDERLTAEGRYFSIGNMFDANREVRFRAEFWKDGVPYLLEVHRSYPRHGFYDATTEVLLSRNGKPREHLLEPASIGGVRVSPAYFTEAHLRTIGDPYLYSYFLRRLQPDQLKAEMKSALNRGQEMDVFVLEGSEVPAFNPWGGNRWVLHE